MKGFKIVSLHFYPPLPSLLGAMGATHALYELALVTSVDVADQRARSRIPLFAATRGNPILLAVLPPAALLTASLLRK
jgi:hypothetical protein